MTEVRQPAPVGVLVVHGVGAQQPGEIVAKLWNGLRRVFPEIRQRSRQRARLWLLAPGSVRFLTRSNRATVMGERMSGTFDFDQFSSLAWFPLFNQIDRAYVKEPYPLWTGFRRSGCPAARRLRPPDRLLGGPSSRSIVGRGPGDAFQHPAFTKTLSSEWRWKGSARQERTAPTRPSLRARHLGSAPNSTPRKGRMSRPWWTGCSMSMRRTCSTTSIRPVTRSALNETVAEELRHVSREIIGDLINQLVRMRNDGCQSIHIVAHSLGTVVMYHALRGLGLDDATRADRPALSDAMASIEHLYTIGSPLEKIRFFWPGLRLETNLAGERPIPWDNFVSYFDPVAGMLRRFHEWGPVNNHRMLGGSFSSRSYRLRTQRRVSRTIYRGSARAGHDAAPNRRTS